MDMCPRHLPPGPVSHMPSTGTPRASTASARPWRASSAIAPGLSESPQSLSRGKIARSSRRTRTPARASTSAAIAPAGPAPTTSTSVQGLRHSARRRARWRCSSIRSRGSCRARRRPLPRVRPRDEVHVAGRIRIGEVGRRRQEAARQRQRRGDDAGGAAGALRMADHRLGGRARHAFGVLAEGHARAAGLDGVVELCGGAVIVDVADLFHGAPRSLDGAAHGRDDFGAVRVHLHAVVGVARRVVALDRRVDAARRGHWRDPRAPRRTSRRPHRAQTRRVPYRRAATLPTADRCSASRRRASARSRRSCPA